MATATVADALEPHAFAGVAVTEPDTSLNWTVIWAAPVHSFLQTLSDL